MRGSEVLGNREDSSNSLGLGSHFKLAPSLLWAGAPHMRQIATNDPPNTIQARGTTSI